MYQGHMSTLMLRMLSYKINSCEVFFFWREGDSHTWPLCVVFSYSTQTCRCLSTHPRGNPSRIQITQEGH